MTRPLRISISDGWYHCMHRGFERRAIFSDQHERNHFLELLGEVVERYRFKIHAYCLMGNHYHTIIQTPDSNLSKGMQWLNLSYSSWYNARHDRVGPLFQGRFKSVLVEEGQWAFDLSLYVHLNPVRTQAYGLGKGTRKAESLGLSTPPTPDQVGARLKKLREYAWSSYRVYGGYEKGPDWLTSVDLLRRGTRRVKERNRYYRQQARQILSHGVEESRLEQFRDVLGIGSPLFIERIKKLAGGGQRETERRARLREKVSFEQVIQSIETCRSESRKKWLNQHGDWGKWMVLRLARQYTGMTLAQLGEQLGGMDYAAVSVGLRRFDQRLLRYPGLKRTFNAAKDMLNV